MKKNGLLNPDIAQLLASTGHTDYIVVTDAGLPIPENVKSRVDLALKKNLPRFLETLDVVLEELIVEKIILAEEIRTASPALEKEILQRFSDVEVEYLPHIDFKEETKKSRGLIRTGEFTSYANIILVAGVAY